MLIGDSVIYDGQVYAVVGFTPTSATPAQVGLTRPDTPKTIWVDLGLVRPFLPPQRVWPDLPEFHPPSGR
jgi:hypothetical protein